MKSFFVCLFVLSLVGVLSSGAVKMTGKRGLWVCLRVPDESRIRFLKNFPMRKILPVSTELGAQVSGFSSSTKTCSGTDKTEGKESGEKKIKSLRWYCPLPREIKSKCPYTSPTHNLVHLSWLHRDHGKALLCRGTAALIPCSRHWLRLFALSPLDMPWAS